MKVLSLDENKFKADFQISTGYINFSSELLRLSLLAVGGFGALVLIRVKGESGEKGFLAEPGLFVISMLFFALCVGASLFHRYFATDCMSWYIAWLRAEEKEDTEKAKKEKTGLHRLLRLSAVALIATEIFFAIGVLTFMIAVWKLLY